MLNTVNVIEFATFHPPGIVSMASFSDDAAGNVAAEAKFKQLVCKSKREVADDELESYLEEGIAEFGDGGNVIVHSC